MDREQIYQRIIESADRFGPNNPQQFQLFGSMLAKCNPEEVFWGLTLVFQRSIAYNHQELAGRLLE
jgi:hypothetical protein